MIDFSKIKFRASSWGNLMTEPQSKADREAGKLSKTCIKELVKIYNQEVYGRKKDITTKHMDKGTIAEPESITLFSRVEKKLFHKNEERLENEWFTGHVDIYEGESIRAAKTVWDIKSRWELDSFMPKLVEDLDTGEELQLQVYFCLTGATSGGIANTLVDCPAGTLMEEKKRLYYSMGVIWEEDPAYLRACAELEKLLTFPDIDYRERVIKQEVTRNDEIIDAMKAKVPRMREWLEEFHKKHLNHYSKDTILV
jgi:hypothetical protein